MRGSDASPFELTNVKKVFWPEEGVHQGRPARLLPRDRPLAAGVSARPAAGDDPLSRRYRGEILLPEGRPGVHPGLDPDRAHVERGHPARDRLLRLRRPRLAALRDQPGSIPIHLWASRAPTLERPDWCVLDLDPKGAPFEHVVEVAKGLKTLCDRIDLPVNDQEHRLLRPAPDDPARPAVHPRAVPLARRAAGPLHRGPAARHRHDRTSGEPARGQGLRRLPPERLRQADRLAVLRASAAGRPGVGAADLARGEQEAGHPAAHHADSAGADAEARRRPAGSRARAEPRPRRRAGSASMQELAE